MAQTRYAFKMSGMYENLEADAQLIGEELETLIEEKNEHVTPDEIIAAARKPSSAMNKLFTWDQEDAAFKWNKKEAKQITHHLVIAKNGKATRTRAFVYVHHPEHAGGKKVLLTTRSAMSNPDTKAQLIEQAVRSLQRSLTWWSSAYGGSPALRRLAKNVAALKVRAERELLQAV